MAASQAFIRIALTEDDVPGAKLLHSDILENSVYRLRRWLECRGLKISGKKQDLVNRINKCIEAKKGSEISITVDNGKWYEIKCRETMQSIPARDKGPPLLPINGWKPFPSQHIPGCFNKGHIYYHLVESAQFVENGMTSAIEYDCQTSKPMRRGQQFFRSGNVQDMKDCKRDGNYHIKAKVLASMTSVMYAVTITISSESGFVQDASCNCKASAMGRCSHVSALLYALLDYTNNHGYAPPSSTSQTCNWNKGRQKKRNPKRVTEANYPSKAKRNVSDVSNFDPRPPSMQNSRLNSQDINKFVTLLQSANQKTQSVSMWQTLLFITYENYELDDTRMDILRKKRTQILENLSVPSHQPYMLVKQQGTDEWFSQRLLRITASNCREIYMANSDKRIMDVLRRKLWEKSPTTFAMQYGIGNEDQARTDFIKLMEDTESNMKVIPTGMWVNPLFPELGCDPDGLIYQPSQPSNKYGVLEIKCPKVLEDIDPNKAKSKLSKEKWSSLCLREHDDGVLSLKTSHQYYFQIQMQMGVTGLSFAYFVVWSKRGIFYQRVTFDHELWGKLKPRLLQFHHSFICPEYFEMRIPRDLEPVHLE